MEKGLISLGKWTSLRKYQLELLMSYKIDTKYQFIELKRPFLEICLKRKDFLKHFPKLGTYIFFKLLSERKRVFNVYDLKKLAPRSNLGFSAPYFPILEIIGDRVSLLEFEDCRLFMNKRTVTRRLRALERLEKQLSRKRILKRKIYKTRKST